MTPIISFADRLQASIERSHSFIVAGFDPRIEDFPQFLLQATKSRYSQTDELIYAALVDFYALALQALAPSVAAVKPNIAFFEQYGLAGLRAYGEVIRMAKQHGLPVIADAKRGDIGNTAAAYSAAFLGRSRIFEVEFSVYDADALTVSPFLGFDTLEPFFKDCQQYGKGIFVLVKTSNPGSSAIQGRSTQTAGKPSGDPANVSETIAVWLASRAEGLMGQCGYSGLGAVVGATFPDEARQLRRLMPSNIFLIPGMGAQGGSAADAVAGFAQGASGKDRGAAVINLSRGLFSASGFSGANAQAWVEELQKRAAKFNAEIWQALQ